MACNDQEEKEGLLCAPVVIPTLCRYDHFTQCIESLSRCTWADRTDVYIGLDYPAKESHWEGYNKIKTYLDTCELKFKSLNVVVRERNYGFGAKGNVATLQKQVLTQYDRFIMSEDDNVFSPNFLVFMNKGLEKFKDDKSVFAINGYRHFYPVKMEKNTFLRQNIEFSAWGYGIWRDRVKNMPPYDYFANSFTLKKFFDVKKDMGCRRALNYWDFCFKPIKAWFDVPWSIYAYLENMDIIMPSEVSLVRNIGWDGSGEHCAGMDDIAQRHLTQKISEKTDFVFEGTGREFYAENRAIYRKYSYAKIEGWVFWRRFCKNLLKYFMRKLCGKGPCGKE
jgi:hypothetical protein